MKNTTITLGGAAVLGMALIGAQPSHAAASNKTINEAIDICAAGIAEELAVTPDALKVRVERIRSNNRLVRLGLKLSIDGAAAGEAECHVVSRTGEVKTLEIKSA